MQTLFRLFLLLLISSMILPSCTKDEEEPVFRIQGTFFNDCDEVGANQLIELWESGDNFLRSAFRTEITTTNENGNFLFTYSESADYVGEKFFISTNGGSRLIDDIPHKQNIDSLIVYRHPSFRLSVRLNVINPYSTHDVLEYYDGMEPHTKRKLAGPFQDGELFYNDKYSIIPWEVTYPTTIKDFYYYINGKTYLKTYEVNSYCNTLYVLDIIIE